MRTALYEEYKKAFPEELFEVGELKARNTRIEKRRKVLSERKQSKVDVWRRKLDAEDRNGS